MEAIIVIATLIVSALYLGLLAVKGETEGSIALIIFKIIPMAVVVGCIYSLYIIFSP